MKTDVSRRHVILAGTAGMLLPASAFAARTNRQATPSALIRLSSNEFISARAILRVKTLANGSLDVTLASGSTLNFANANDIQQIQARLTDLNDAKQSLSFRPDDNTLVNLSQVTNVWNDAEEFRFWGMDGMGYLLPPALDRAKVWARLSTLCQSSYEWAGLIRVTDELIVNTFHCAHISTIEGQLRFHMSNKTWPNIQSVEQSDAARKTLTAAIAEDR